MSAFNRQVEKIFETFLWKTRLITLLAVVFSLLSSLLLFLAGSVKIVKTGKEFFGPGGESQGSAHLLSPVISAVDLYLIGVVLLIFSFGIYELFISKIDPAENDREINILEIKNLDDLKNRLLKVIVMALIVHFFKAILDTPFHSPLDMVYLALSILMVSACTYFIRKVE